MRCHVLKMLPIFIVKHLFLFPLTFSLIIKGFGKQIDYYVKYENRF